MNTATYYSDDQVTLHHGDALEVARSMESGSVDCIVTSPPYFGLRDYGEPGQYGLEESPAKYVETMRALFAELRRILADDGTLWLNLGDSYYSGKGSPSQPDVKNEARRPPERILDRPGAQWSRPKNLLGIPWRVAFALQDDGWILRNDIIWSKPNAMPESVTDRLAGKHEHLFMFSRTRRYHFDLDSIREEQSEATAKRMASGPVGPGRALRHHARRARRAMHPGWVQDGRHGARPVLRQRHNRSRGRATRPPLRRDRPVVGLPGPVAENTAS